MKREIERVVEGAMTVEDLIAELQQFPADTHVMFACDYGDYNHTQQALPVESIDEFGEKDLADSAYSKSGVALVETEDGESYFCPKCEEEFDAKTCPICGTPCVDETGKPVADDDEDTATVVILR